MTDGINAGEESDRLLITWLLDSPEAESAAAGRPAEADVENLLQNGAAVVLSVGPAGEPVSESSLSARTLLCQVPDDVVAVRRAEPALARSWRLALRSVLVDAFAAGYAVSAATRSGWYVLLR
jgi:predicted GNAT superfamily acetyltransferase